MHAASSVFEFTVRDIKGGDVPLDVYRGKVLLIVNVASKCGYTKQYAGLESLSATYKDRGLVVMGFPCNQFGGQEPGTAEEIQQFCTLKFDVKFPLFAKVDVNGANRHPLFTFLTGDTSPFPGKVSWNFNKFLVGRDGKLIARYDSKTTPESADLIQSVEAALAAK
jgi:glutathione peroxidase